MKPIRMDKRKLVAERDPEGDALARAGAARELENFLALAPVLLRLHEKASFVFHACSSIGHYAERFLRMDAVRARQGVDVGRALRAFEGLAAQVLSGEMPIRSAGQLGRLLGVPDAVAPAQLEPWRRLALTKPPEEFRRLVLERIEAVTQETPVASLTLAVPLPTREKFARARTIASERADRVLSDGETFTLVLDHYLDAFDPDRRATSTRRVGPTAENPRSRYVPREVQRAIRTRAENRCEVAGCGRTMFLEFAHLHAHASGESGREEDDLFLPCGMHHREYDAGLLRFLRWQGGKPVFANVEGEVFAPPPAAPREYEAPDEAGSDPPDLAGQVSEGSPPEWGGRAHVGERFRARGRPRRRPRPLVPLGAG